MSRVLALDLGQSGCRATVVVDGRSRARNDTVGLRPGVDASTIIAAAARSAIGGTSDTEWKVAVGMTGLNGGAPPAERVAHSLEAEGIHGELAVCDDSVTAYLGALGPRSGAVVAAGTGAVALAADIHGGVSRSDGWGAYLGDRGSGYWIGMQAIRRALRDADAGRRGALLALVENEWGTADSLSARWRDALPEPPEVAGFATAIADLAREGDLDAIRIWHDAGRRLADSAADAIDGVGLTGRGTPVAGVGGVFSARELIESAFVGRLIERDPSAVPVAPDGDSLDGAVAIATALLPDALEGLVTRRRIDGEATAR